MKVKELDKDIEGVKIAVTLISAQPVLEKRNSQSIYEIKPQENCENAKKKINKKCNITIFKPLVPLKLALFFWTGAVSAVGPFLSVYLKQRGFSVTEFSFIFVLLPIVHFFTPLVSNIIIDKIGRSKAILIANILVSTLCFAAILFIPSMAKTDCATLSVHLSCDSLEKVTATTSCGLHSPFQVTNCKVINRLSQSNENQSFNRDINTNNNFYDSSLVVSFNASYSIEDECFYSIDATLHNNTAFNLCELSPFYNASMFCTLPISEKCDLKKEYRTKLLISTSILMVLFLTSKFNCYQLMAVTTVFLVKKYDKDFGQQKVLSRIGKIGISLFAGYLVSATTIDPEHRNYMSAFYIFFVLVAASLISFSKLDIHINPPGKMMWKKSTTLFKKQEFISFLIVILVLGIAKSYTHSFLNWNLVDLKAPSILLGLIPAMSSLYGIPFLQTSNWWITKIGTRNLFVLSFFAFSINCLGYSLIQNPWWALALESTEIVTQYLFGVAYFLHCHDIAPEGLTATVIALSGGFYHDIGKALGSLIGGQIMAAYDARTTYRVFSVASLISGILYLTYLRFQSRTKNIEKIIEERKCSEVKDVNEKNSEL